MEKSKEARSKAEAIRGFLDQHQPKLPEARGFLQFLLAKEDILRRLEIVHDLTGRRNSILVSAKGSGTWPFFYRRGERVFHRTSQAVVELMKYVPDQIALCLSTVPPAWDDDIQEFVTMLARWREETFSDEVIRLRRKHDLMQEIDSALDQGDEDRFIQLSNELRQWT